MSIEKISSKKWHAINSGSVSRRIFPHKKEKRQKDRNNKTTVSLVEEEPKLEDHHVWDKPHRNKRNVSKRNEIKVATSKEHDIWHKYAKNLHPKVAFVRIVRLCMGKIRATEDEVEDLKALAGFDWRNNPNKAIVSIFEKFMPSELGEMIKPYSNGIK